MVCPYGRRGILLTLLCSALNAATVTVRVNRAADPVEKLAASELAQYLGKLYPADCFTRSATPGNSRPLSWELPATLPNWRNSKTGLVNRRAS